MMADCCAWRRAGVTGSYLRALWLDMGWLGYVEFQWVRADQRGSGLGTRVLAAAEEEVRRRGCEQVALSTHSFQAPRFYARRGYVECGRTPAYPRGHDQIHLVKRLD